jgi:hypothetical protein
MRVVERDENNVCSCTRLTESKKNMLAAAGE